MQHSISVVGLGKLGICLAACAASKGAAVAGVDLSARTVAEVNQGRAPVLEPGLDEMITLNRHRLTATQDVRRAVGESDMTFVVVPTPSEPKGGFSLKYVLEACHGIGEALRTKASYHLVVVVSTVLPGSMESVILPALEKSAGKRCGEDFGLCYGPEFIALGDVLKGMLQPDFILIGQSDHHAGERLEAFYRTFCDRLSQVCRMNFVNAELTKIAVNTFVTTKITFANMLSALCGQLPGANIDTVTNALGFDSRIGGRYLTGGLGYGGPCFPRDNRALAHAARILGCDAGLAEATDALNHSYSAGVIEHIKCTISRDKRVAVLGLAYKANTNVIEDSQPLAIARELARSGYQVVVYDSHALDNARLMLGDQVSYACSIAECLREVQAVIVAGAGKEFRILRAQDFPKNGVPMVVFDCWRILQRELSDRAWITYVPLGVGQAHDRSSARSSETSQPRSTAAARA